MGKRSTSYGAGGMGLRTYVRMDGWDSFFDLYFFFFSKRFNEERVLYVGVS